MPFNDWLSLAIICILGAFSPGPSLMVILTLTASDGRRSGLKASLGHGLGVFLYALFSTSTLGLLLTMYKQLFVFVQISGAIFLCYLGIRIIWSSFAIKLNNAAASVSHKKVSKAFFDGFLIAILNPKIGVFFFSLFSQFLMPKQTAMTHLGMASLAGFIDTIAYIIMVLLFSTSVMLTFFSLYKKSVQFFFGVILIFLSLSLCLTLIMEYYNF